MDPVYSGHPSILKRDCYREAACIRRLTCTLLTLVGLSTQVVIERWPANTVTIVYRFFCSWITVLVLLCVHVCVGGVCCMC